LSTDLGAVTASAALIAVQTTPSSAARFNVGWSMHLGPQSPLPNCENRTFIAGVEQEIGRPLAYDTRYYRRLQVAPVMGAGGEALVRLLSRAVNQRVRV
jgi:hypothetical protein